MINLKVSTDKFLDLDTVLGVVQNSKYGHPRPSQVTDTDAVTSRLDSVIELLGLIAIQNAKLANRNSYSSGSYSSAP